MDGDGYDDVIVGSPYYDFESLATKGWCWVYLGSSSGTEVAPGLVQGQRPGNAHFGYAVGTAGDVNGDGYAEVIVGAPYFNFLR